MFKRIVLFFSLCFMLISHLSLSAQTRRIVEHVVREKETVYSISKHYDTSVERIYEINPWARSGIRVGDKLIVYQGTDKDKASNNHTEQGPSQTKATPTLSTERIHTIVAGETLYGISRRYGLTEQELLLLNPGISSQHFPVGAVLKVYKGALDTIAPNMSSSLVTKDLVSLPEIKPVRVLLMLPFRKATRYLEFYQGFLMGLNDLKKDGISINLTALEANDDEAVSHHIFNGVVRDFDYVIGGVTEEQCRLLAQATRFGYYIVPFSDFGSVQNSRLIQLNQSPIKVVDRVIPRFIERYKDRSVLFASRGEEVDEPFVVKLKKALQEANITYQTVNVATSNFSPLLENYVIVPTSSDKRLAEMVFQALGANHRNPVFGYPQWQSYGGDFQARAQQYHTTIYSTFYFDKYTSEAKQFLTRFNAWYNKKVLDSYPKYSVLGYDVARYFVRAYAAHGNSFIEHSKQIPSDGLQMDIELERSREHEGYTNSRFYFVSFKEDGTTIRESL